MKIFTLIKAAIPRSFIFFLILFLAISNFLLRTTCYAAPPEKPTGLKIISDGSIVTTAGVLVPTDGATGVTTTTEITMTFANMTDLEINSFEVTTRGSPITGTLTYKNNSLSFSHAPLINAAMYTVTIEARIRDTDGVVKQVAIASPPWTFTVVDQTDPNVIIFKCF